MIPQLISFRFVVSPEFAKWPRPGRRAVRRRGKKMVYYRSYLR